MAEDQQGSTGDSPRDELLREIREDYSYFRDYWRENYEEAKTDLRFVAGDPWEPGERQAREDNGRPVVSPDELDQYLNQAINNLRQSPRAIKVNPAGAESEDKDAEARSSIIAGIEYRSNAQSAYVNAYECALSCGFGFFRVTTKTVSKDGEVEPRVKIIENPLSVLLDPNAKESDFSDQKKCFVMDVMREADFSRRFPNAQKKSFSGDDIAQAPDWFQGKNILVAEYWRIDGYDDDGNNGTVTQYITNGLEILEENEWAGSWIPVIAVLGKKVYAPRGGDTRRMFYSMIRKARGPQMMLAYIASQEAEEYGMAPRAPFVTHKGQISDGNRKTWETLNKVPRAWVEVDRPDWWNDAWGPPPIPQRPQFTPNAQAYEIGREAWRRSIQSSVGIVPLPTPAQQQNDKSGVALERIQTQQAIGAFHFTDNLDRALEFAGRQLNELITKVIDTPRHMGIRHQDETHTVLHVVPEAHQKFIYARDPQGRPYKADQGTALPPNWKLIGGANQDGTSDTATE